MRAAIALGSNVGDRAAMLRAARARIENLTALERPVLASAMYETEPVGCEPGAGNFLNAVIEIGYAGDATELLAALRVIERDLGRPSIHPRNVSRTIDLDLLYYGDLTFDTPALQLPHPRLHERAFVLRPLAEIRPDLQLPNQTVSVVTLLTRLSETSDLVRTDTEW
jgi:2-amino-4-hydroxy-6-hydroxymethyldihydropteridine diphosphokinase